MVVTAHLNPVVMIAAALGAVVVGTVAKPVLLPPRLRLPPLLLLNLPVLTAVLPPAPVRLITVIMAMNVLMAATVVTGQQLLPL